MSGAGAGLEGAQVYDAALLMLRTWARERRHEEGSPYYYAELPRGGRGAQSNYTGESNMSTGFSSAKGCVS